MREDNNIPKGWVETTLGEVVNIIGGGTPRTTVSEYWGGDIPWLSVVDFNNDNRWVYDTEKTITELGLEKSSTKLLNAGDIIISARGTVGAMAQLKREMAFNQSCYGIKELEDVSNIDFLFYLIKYNLTQINRNTYGAVFDTITRITFDVINIKLPPLPEQQAIASILTSFDDKIELLQAQNETLEAIAQTIFKEWFGKYKIGDELPEGWRVGKLGKEFDITIGRTPPRKETEWFSDTPTGKKWISIRDIGNSGVYISNTSEYLTDKAIDKFNIPVIPKNTTIMSFKMTVGKLTITTEDMLSNEAIAHLKLKKDTPISSEFIFLHLQGLDFNALGSTSSIVTAINSTMIKNMEFIIPDKKRLKSFDDLIQPLFEKIKYNTQQIQTLTQTRDTLLPKLMSGKLRVEEFRE